MQVTYVQNGQQKQISEEQAMQMVNQIAEQDMQRALIHLNALTQANPSAHNLLSDFYDKLLGMYLFEELLELTSRRLQQRPDCGIAFSRRLDALQHMYRNDEAIAMLREAYLKDPMDYNAVTHLGGFYKDVGDSEKALVSFNQAIQINPHYAPPYWHRADMVDDHAEMYQAVTEQISLGKVDESRAHFLQFAAYRHAEKMGEYDAAFEHLSFGNGLKRHLLKYDLGQEIAIDEKAKEVFSPERLQALNPESNSDLKPIFILGMPRSGTTLVEQIIASHSQVAGGDEYTALANAVMRAQRASNDRTRVDQWLQTRDNDDWQRIGRAYEDNMRHVRQDKLIFTDKNQFNHRSVGVIKAALPNAKIIMVDRQPMDVLFGCYRQLFGNDGAPFSYQFDELIGLYQSYNSLMDYWCDNTDNLIKRVRYEDLVENTEAVTNDILAYCGLEVEQACYDFHNSDRAVKTLSSQQVRRPIFTDGIDRWKTYQSQLQPLIKHAETAGLALFD